MTPELASIKTSPDLSKELQPHVCGVGTALPANQVRQADVRAFARMLFASYFRDIDRLVTIFENSLIQSRHFCMPLEWFETPKNFTEKNALYVEHALDLGELAARRALEHAKIDPDQIAAILFVSTTGISTPSLDSVLLKRLGLSKHTMRVPIWGLGCAGGAAGLARAAEIARAHPGKHVLLVAVELCSLTFVHGDRSKSNLVATSIFGDGAAAVVVGPASTAAGVQPRLLGSSSTLIDDSEDVMGWDLIESGLKVRFAKSVPELVHALMRENLIHATKSNGLSFEQLRHFVTHPGGVKVLQAYQDSLGLEKTVFEDSYRVLEACGNMSSVSVLFVLEHFLSRMANHPEPGLGALSAMGPGFSAEHVLFEL